MAAISVQNLGKYQVLNELGRGGFATVYRARDPELGRDVALKVLDPLLTRDPVWVARFRREARSVASLDHPRIVTVYEIGQAEGALYIAMRLVEDGSLAMRLAAQGPLPWDEVVRLTGQIAEALDFAHDQGVLHRDLKPANVLLDKRLGAVLTDFGFARLMADNSLSMSLSGGVVGTPAYIAPEIWEGEESTAQTDVYALGCIVYELVVGQTLFVGNSTPAVMRAHFQPRKLPATWPEGVPNGLTDVLLTALAQEPAARYVRAVELVAALAGLREDALAVPYAELLSAVEDGRWQEALTLAGQIRAVDSGYRDMSALEEAALTGLEHATRTQQAAIWREESERALAEGDVKGASIAVHKWQELMPDDPAVAKFLAQIEREMRSRQTAVVRSEAEKALAEEDLQHAKVAGEKWQKLTPEDPALSENNSNVTRIRPFPTAPSFETSTPEASGRRNMLVPIALAAVAMLTIGVIFGAMRGEQQSVERAFRVREAASQTEQASASAAALTSTATAGTQMAPSTQDAFAAKVVMTETALPRVTVTDQAELTTATPSAFEAWSTETALAAIVAATETAATKIAVTNTTRTAVAKAHVTATAKAQLTPTVMAQVPATAVPAVIIAEGPATTALNGLRIVAQNSFNQQDVILSEDEVFKHSIMAGRDRWELKPGNCNNWWFWGGDQSGRRFAVAQDYQFVSGPADSEFSLMFRRTGNDHYLFTIRGNQFSVRLYRDDSLRPLIDWTTTDAIARDKMNHLLVVGEDTYFQFFINDKLVGTAEDATLSGGVIGIHFYSCPSDQPAIFEFDNFELRAP